MTDILNRFRDRAAALGVAPEVVADAAAHTFDMLDMEQQHELISEARERWAAHQMMAGARGVVFAERPNQMRDDMLYRLQHEQFDLVYALAVRLKDSASPEEAQWLLTPPRRDEPETPPSRVSAAMEYLVRALRHAKRGFESVQREHDLRTRRER